jgi:imidazolonepropionase-like amidohydrolase
MSARDMLAAATVDAARLLDVEAGTLEPGAIADLVLLRTDIDAGDHVFRDHWP